ncbi:MAG: GNAT family N-acetyltransferase [Lachnospiraceae bacterium]|nr:GNAT family N-acetyltransferase [Lachnospiraceae bacterium]
MIRRAKEKDIPDIGRLLFQVNNVHAKGRGDIFKKDKRKYRDDELKEIIKDDMRPIFVLTEDESGKLLGYAFCIFEIFENDNNLQDRKVLYIDDLCVDEKERGKHIGQRLYEYVCSYAREENCHSVTLNVWSCNPSAMRFYEAMGLKPYKVCMENIL